MFRINAGVVAGGRAPSSGQGDLSAARRDLGGSTSTESTEFAEWHGKRCVNPYRIGPWQIVLSGYKDAVFTGIIEALGRVTELHGSDLAIAPLSALGDDPIRIGESIAVNGCCLTVAAADGNLRFNLSPETVSRTTLGSFKPGMKVNLERAMRADGRFGGHLVQGHIDATGTVVSITPADGATVMRFRAPQPGARYLIDKGSIAVDGISLTVVSPEDTAFDTWIVPHTLESTNLENRVVGDPVNLEYDVLAKYAERLLS